MFFAVRLLSLLASFALNPSLSQAGVEVLFHPKDPTLARIADWIGSAQKIDIAMYNMDLTDASPIIQKLKSELVQAKIKNGELQIRMIFEGYGTRPQANEKLKIIEALGVDAKYLGKQTKVHHKFAVIDTGHPNQRVITGSANWSSSSARNYNENILFFEQQSEINFRFQQEFNRLWKKSKAFGIDLKIPEVIPTASDQPGLQVFFNSPRLLKTDLSESTLLQDELGRAIDAAQNEILVATTRVRLESLLTKIKAAADRGIQIKIIINQDDFKDLYKRAQWLVNQPNIQLRVKFFNLQVGNYLTYQMHNKMMVVDQKVLITGSFNWSHSGENFHIENLIQIESEDFPEVVQKYVQEILWLFELGRDQLPALLDDLAKTKARGEKPKCAFNPTALEVSEITFMISEYRSCDVAN